MKAIAIIPGPSGARIVARPEPPSPHRMTGMLSFQDAYIRHSGLLVIWRYGDKKMTFSVPEPLAVRFLSRVASRDRSRFVSEALAAQLRERDLELVRACETANQDLDVAEIEKDFDAIRDELAEPWK